MSEPVPTPQSNTLFVSNLHTQAHAPFDARATTSAPNVIVVPDIVPTLPFIQDVAAPDIYETHILPVAGEHIPTDVCNVFNVEALTVILEPNVGVVQETVAAITLNVVLSQKATVKAFVS